MLKAKKIMKFFEGKEEELKQLIKDRYISINKHPETSLYIYNYTKHCQYDRHWNDITLQCRGLILDENLNVISRPFKKFFNYDEFNGQPVRDRVNLKYKLFNKMDGSMGISYTLNDKWYIASRGSFDSDFADKANEILYRDNVDALFAMKPKYTYLFEIIFPENRIVVNYGEEEKLVLLAIIETKTGKEMDLEHYNPGFELSKEYKMKQEFNDLSLTEKITKLQKLNLENKEGFVILFEDGHRIKIKFDDYIRLHSLMFHVSSRTIWKAFKEDIKLEQYVKELPDEIHDWCSKEYNELKIKFSNIENLHIKIVKEYERCQNLKERQFTLGEVKSLLSKFKKIGNIDKNFYNRLEQEKNRLQKEKNDFFNWVNESYKGFSKGLILAIYDKTNYQTAIFEKIKPEFKRPFWTY